MPWTRLKYTAYLDGGANVSCVFVCMLAATAIVLVAEKTFFLFIHSIIHDFNGKVGNKVDLSIVDLNGKRS